LDGLEKKYFCLSNPLFVYIHAERKKGGRWAMKMKVVTLGERGGGEKQRIYHIHMEPVYQILCPCSRNSMLRFPRECIPCERTVKSVLTQLTLVIRLLIRS